MPPLGDYSVSHTDPARGSEPCCISVRRIDIAPGEDEMRRVADHALPLLGSWAKLVDQIYIWKNEFNLVLKDFPNKDEAKVIVGAIYRILLKEFIPEWEEQPRRARQTKATRRRKVPQPNHVGLQATP